MNSLRVPSIVVIASLAAILVTALLAAASDAMTIRYLRDVLDGAPVAQERAELSSFMSAVTRLMKLGARLLCLIVFLFWFYRAQDNLVQSQLRGVRYTGGWTIAGFFIPFLNLVRPCQVMNETHAGSAFLAKGGTGRAWRGTVSSGPVAIWWGMLLLQTILSRVDARGFASAETGEELLSAAWVGLASSLFDVPTVAAAVYLVLRITRFQEVFRKSREPDDPLLVV